MPTLYVDSGSFNNLQVTGSTVLSGSGTVLRVVGSGSSIFVVSGSSGEIFKVEDTSASSTTLFTVVSSSITILSVNENKTVNISGSLIVTGSITGSLFGTSSWADSSSHALTASYLLGGTSSTPGGANTTIQFNGSNTFSGSNNFTFNSASNQVQLTGSLRTSGSIEATVGLGVENYKSPNRWALLSTTGCPSVTGQALTSGSANSITTILVPFITNKTITVSSMSFESTTTPSPSTASVGIYAADQVTCRPTTLITSMSNIPIPSNRVYSGSLTTGPVTLSPGLYYTAFQHSGSATITFRSIPTANTMNIIGLTTPGNTTVPNYYAGVRAGGPASLPASTSSFSTLNPLGGLNPPCIWMLIS
jgi:hypothetical protein